MVLILGAKAAIVFAASVGERMKNITLPDRFFRDEPVSEILRYIEEESARADPDGVGIPLVVMDNEQCRVERTRLTLTFRGVTVEEALRLVAAAAALSLRIEESAVVIAPSKNVVGPSRP